MDESPKHERQHPDSRSDKSGSSKKSKSLADIDTKSVLYIIGILYAVLNGWILYRFSEEFTVRFETHIQPVKDKIEIEQDYIKRDLGKAETKIIDIEKRTRDLEIKAGGKR